MFIYEDYNGKIVGHNSCHYSRVPDKIIQDIWNLALISGKIQGATPRYVDVKLDDDFTFNCFLV